MCGIIGIVSKKQVVDRLINGLERLEYRGYDSSGVATISNTKIAYTKSIGKLISLKSRLKNETIDGYVGIGHTRWATHGEPTEINAHPHVTKNVAVVHNGIIEKFLIFSTGCIHDSYDYFRIYLGVSVIVTFVRELFLSLSFRCLSLSSKHLKINYLQLLS